MNPSATATRLVPAERLSAIGSIVAEHAVFKGNFDSEKDLGIKIDGRLTGNITFKIGGTVHIGPAAVLDSSVIEADFVLIEGKVTGNIIARKSLEITGSATLIGDAQYDELIDLHPRARIRGKLEYRGSMESEAT